MRHTVIRRLAPLVVALGLLVAVATPVGAAPSNAKKAEFVDLACTNGAAYSIVANGNGLFSPGHILDADGQNLIPVAFRFVVTNTTGDVLFDETVAKPGQMNGLSGELIDCTFTETETDPESGETVTINGTVTLFVVPRH